MKIFFSLFAIVLAFVSCQESQVHDKSSTVNQIIGDISFLEAFGVYPDDQTDESLRIQTHLKYVQGLLRNKEVSHLSPDLRDKRKQALDHLNDYWQAGIFPTNNAYPGERKPCFIDDAGRICAVGYLVEQTAGRKLAEEINQQAQYALLEEMEIPELDRWVAQSGFEKEELAMIQPAYGQPSPTPVVPKTEVVNQEYGMFSILFSMSNLTFSGVNIHQMAHRNQYHSKRLAWFGMGFGLGQATWGMLGMPKNPTDREAFPKTTNISWANISLGAGTMLLSTGNLLLNKKLEEKQMSLYLYSPKLNTSQFAYGIGLTKRF